MKNFYSKQKIQKGKGFTLLELLLYIGILGFLMVIVTDTFISLSKGSGQSQARSEVNSAIRFSTELMRQDVKNATTITTPASAGGTSSSLVVTRGVDTITYDVDVSRGVLRKKVGAGAYVDVTNANITVGTPTFTRIENVNTVFGKTDITIKINMTFSYKGSSPDWTYSNSLQTTVGLY